MIASRRLAAILAADVVGYSRLMGADEEGTHERLKGHLRELVDPKIKEHRGRIVKKTEDGFLAEFALEPSSSCMAAGWRTVGRWWLLPRRSAERHRLGSASRACSARRASYRPAVDTPGYLLAPAFLNIEPEEVPP
jgi:class 3 adenylate cyclase